MNWVRNCLASKSGKNIANTFFEPTTGTGMMLYLRRTLVQLKQYSAINTTGLHGLFVYQSFSSNKKRDTMIHQPYTTLSNGIKMPLLGLGVYDMYNTEAEQAVTDALEIGYRLIDTASLYNNEKEIGNAVKQSAVQRNEIFVTTKVGNGDQGYDSTLRAFDESLKKLQMDYVDLYLVHWPIKGKRMDTWKALEKLYAEGCVKAIGVANYLIPFLEELSTYSTTVPVLNQVELTPWLFQSELIDYCVKKNIQLQSYSPITRGQKLNDPRLLLAFREIWKDTCTSCFEMEFRTWYFYDSKVGK
jgi:diketogulonate reductase-like aldo/keto reductase